MLYILVFPSSGALRGILAKGKKINQICKYQQLYPYILEVWTTRYVFRNNQFAN